MRGLEREGEGEGEGGSVNWCRALDKGSPHLMRARELRLYSFWVNLFTRLAVANALAARGSRSMCMEFNYNFDEGDVKPGISEPSSALCVS